MNLKKSFAFLLILSLIFTFSSLANIHKLKGTVTNDNGKPLIGILISLLPANVQTADKLVTVTDKNGNYTFENLKRGKYKVAATTLDGAALKEKRLEIGDVMTYRRDFVMNLEAIKSVNEKAIDTEWVLRSGKRDILRNESNIRGASPLQNEMPSSVDLNSLNAKLSVGTEKLSNTNSEPINTTKLDLFGDINKDSNWKISAEMKNVPKYQPTFEAIGRYRNKIMSDVNFEVGLDFKEFHNINTNNSNFDLDNLWIGSLYTKNSWQVWEPLQLNCSLRLDHYNNSYYEGESFLSPTVEIVYEPTKWAKMKGSIGIETVHPNSSLSDFDEIPTIVQDDLRPERATKYQLCFEGGITGGYLITFHAFYSNIENKRLTFLPSQNNTSNRILYNAGDSVVSGLTFDFKKSVSNWLSGTFSYKLSKAVVLDARSITLVFDNMDQIELLLGQEIAHELSTKLDAKIEATKTSVSAEYRFIVGSLGPDEFETGYVDTQRLDIKLIQKLPFLAFTGTDWEIHLNVRNLFNSHGMDYFLNTEDIMGARRKISGGISIHF